MREETCQVQVIFTAVHLPKYFIVAIKGDMEQKNKSSNGTYPVKDLVQRLYADHSYESTESTVYSREMAGINKIASENFHLMHLLTTNPAAALPPLFPRSIQAEHIPGYKFLTLRGGENTVTIPETFLTPSPDTFKITGYKDTGDSMKNPWNRSQLYATEEEIQQKGNCWGGEGKEFDFDALLPADYLQRERLNTIVFK